jgi:hypothetical protein
MSESASSAAACASLGSGATSEPPVRNRYGPQLKHSTASLGMLVSIPIGPGPSSGASGLIRMKRSVGRSRSMMKARVPSNRFPVAPSTLE